METNLSLLYDKDCPLCRWYTALFVKYGLLPENGRIAYTDYVKNHPGVVDSEVAQTKIACVNNNTREVNYGIDSLLLILGQRFKFIQWAGKLKPVYFSLQLLYLFISYNRKIVAPGPQKSIDCACEPAKSVFWRITFIIVIGWLTYLNVDWYFGKFLTEHLILYPANDLILLLAQLTFQWLAFSTFGQKNSYDYLGHLAFTSFLGSLLLLFFGLVLLLLDLTGVSTGFLALVCYGITIAFLFFEHKRRVQLKGWTWKLSISWVLFRLIIYPFVFQL